jgi:hypothetical protein
MKDDRSKLKLDGHFGPMRAVGCDVVAVARHLGLDAQVMTAEDISRAYERVMVENPMELVRVEPLPPMPMFFIGKKRDDA